MTAQDQQSRAVIAAWNAQTDEHNQWETLGDDEKIEWAMQAARALPAPVICYVRPGATRPRRMGWETCAATDAGALAVHADGRALPDEGLEPVAWTVAGAVTNWARDFSKYKTQHYVRPVFTAAQVLAMLEHAGAGRGAESEGKLPQTRMDTGAHPGAGLPPDQSPCRRNPFYNGPSNCLIGTAGCFVDSHRGRGRQPAAPATTEPQAPTTGAGSVTAGAAQKRTPLANEQVAKRGQVGAIHTEPGGKVCMLPAQYRQELEQRYAKGFRDAERAHGIK